MRLILQGSQYAVGTLAPVLVMIVVTPFITRTLGATQYGDAAVATTISQSASVLLALGLPAAITRYILIEAGGDAEGVRIAVTGALFAIVASICAAGALLIVSQDTEPVMLAVSASPISGASLAVTQIAQSVLRARQHPLRFVVIGILFSLVPPALALWGISEAAPNASTYMWILSTAQMVIACSALALVCRLRVRLSQMHEFFRAVRVGLPTVPHSISMALLVTFAVALARVTSGPELAGSVQIAALIGTAPIIVIGALNNAWAPAVYKTAKSDRQLMLQRSTRDMAGLLMLIVLCYLPTIPLFVWVVGGSVVDATTPQLATLISVSAAFHLVYLANIHLTFASGKTWPLAFTTPSAVTLAFITLMLTAPLFHDSLKTYSIVWITFHGLQGIIASRLTRFAGYRPLSPKGIWPQLTLAIVAPLASGLLNLNLAATAGVSVTCALIGTLAWTLSRKIEK